MRSAAGPAAARLVQLADEIADGRARNRELTEAIDAGLAAREMVWSVGKAPVGSYRNTT